MTAVARRSMVKPGTRIGALDVKVVAWSTAPGPQRAAARTASTATEGVTMNATLGLSGGSPRALPGTAGELSQITNRLVQLHKEFYGRGPDTAKTHWSEDVVVCVLRGGFTRLEHTLREEGRENVVLEQRMAFQEVMRGRFMEAVSDATGHQVIGYMSGNQSAPDMFCEVFVLGEAREDEAA